MFRIGSTIRSAKMNAATPPKLIPPFHSTAASGTFPIEHTKESIATSGPTSGPQTLAQNGCRTRKNDCQNDSGTQAARAPAMSKPPPTSTQIDAQAMTKKLLIAVNPRREVILDRREPPVTDISIAACPSILPAM